MIADELGVSDATISRDLKAIFPGAIECPVCACRHPMERWRELERQGRVTLGRTASDDEVPPPGRDDHGDVDCDERRRDGSGSGQRGEVALDDHLQRLKQLTDEMAAQNAAGIIGVNAEPVEPSPSP